ncbi:MAG: PqqD family protein, partial [Aquisalinus sp.]|nr:PqqD family protein [Aquisalinus sp.]
MKYRARTANLEVQVLEHETLIYDPSNGGACHVLNQSAAAVWRLCDGERTVSDLAAELAMQTGLPEDEQIVELALTDLRAANLVEEIHGQSSSTLPQHGVERRALMKRLGFAAGSAALLPAVDSMLAPVGLQLSGVAYAQQSVAPRGFCVVVTEATTTATTQPQETTAATRPQEETTAATRPQEETTAATRPQEETTAATRPQEETTAAT